MRIDYPDLELLHARARRERAQAVYHFIIEPVVRFFSHAPRTHIAAQRPRGGISPQAR
jgi:hypothetical protein